MKHKVLSWRGCLWGILGCMFACGFWSALPSVSDAAPSTLVYDRNRSTNVLAGRTNSDLVMFSNGKRMKVGDIRALQALSEKMRAAKVSAVPFAFKNKIAATGTPVKTSADLSAALQRNKDSETLQLKSGRITVEQLKFLQPELEKRTGRKLGASVQAPNLTAPAEKVTAKSDWKAILNKPDSYVIESKNNKRITVGMLKQVLAKKPDALPAYVHKAISPASMPKQK